MEYQEYEKIILDHLKRVEPDRDYTQSPDDEPTRTVAGTVEWVTEDAWDFELENEMLAYIDEHPDAKLEDMERYLVRIAPVLEIVDDDEVPEEERNPYCYD